MGSLRELVYLKIPRQSYSPVGGLVAESQFTLYCYVPAFQGTREIHTHTRDVLYVKRSTAIVYVAIVTTNGRHEHAAGAN